VGPAWNETKTARRPALRQRLSVWRDLPSATRRSLPLPYADTDMIQFHLNEILSNVAATAHAMLRLDKVGWHITKLETSDNKQVPACIGPTLSPVVTDSYVYPQGITKVYSHDRDER
jgi:hypothetical protein